jgi:hypothetical protein
LFGAQGVLKLNITFGFVCSSAADTSASARISKGQGYQVFLRKRANRFGQKRAIFVVQGKT